MSAVDPNNPPLQSGNAGWFFESGFYSLYAVPDSTLAVENLVNNVDIICSSRKIGSIFWSQLRHKFKSEYSNSKLYKQRIHQENIWLW